MIIIPIAFSIIQAHCITRRELHRALKMLLNEGKYCDNSERPKEQTHAGNYTGGEPVGNESGRSGGVVGEAKCTGSSGNTQGREFKRIENPRPRQSKRIKKRRNNDITSLIMSL